MFLHRRSGSRQAITAHGAGRADTVLPRPAQPAGNRSLHDAEPDPAPAGNFAGCWILTAESCLNQKAAWKYREDPVRSLPAPVLHCWALISSRAWTTKKSPYLPLYWQIWGFWFRNSFMQTVPNVSEYSKGAIDACCVSLVNQKKSLPSAFYRQ